jgi:hypothetical protein
MNPSDKRVWKKMRGGLLLHLALLSGATAFQLYSGGRVHVQAVRCAAPLLSTEGEDTPPPKKTDEEGDALAKAFARRLEQEGGATQFKIKTTVSDATDTVKDSLASVGDAAKNVQLPSADGVLNASPFQLLGGLFVVSILFAVISSSSGPQADMGTSDGTTLEFGQRSSLREVPLNPYQPEYGRQ